jgi:hypothetical protein
MWQLSAERKRQERQAQSGGGGGGLQPAASGKGDRFFSNLVPSFAKRDNT